VELTHSSVSTILQDLLPKCEKAPPAVYFAQKIVSKTFEERGICDSYIKRHSANWRFERIAVIDLLILRIAICEFMNFFDVPPKVTIDEAIELAKRYSTYKSSGYINGILDAVLLDLKDEGHVIKTGRGRIGKKNKKQSKEK
jgi:N utilization substance protein B